LLIQLDPSPLHIKKCLTHIRIIIALEYSRNPGNVGYRGPETPFTYGGELRVKLAMYRSPALIDPPPPDCAGPISGPPRLTISVVLVAGVGCGLIFRDRIKIDDEKTTIVLAFFRQ
jgi:hypothetical protein